MSRTINEFYDAVIALAMNLPVLPIRTDEFVYDPRFNDQYVINMIAEDVDNSLDEIDRYYRSVITSVDMMTNDDTLVCIGDSDEVGDPPECGDFNYYIGFINDECPIQFQQSSHIFAYPSRIIFYSPQFQIEVCSYDRYIGIYDVVPKVRNMFMIKNENERAAAVKAMLRSSDRPILDQL